MKPALRVIGIAAALVVVPAAAWVAWAFATSPIVPQGWQAPPSVARDGVWAVNATLAQVNRLEIPAPGSGPEDVHEIDGYVYGGLQDGRILRWPRTGGAPTVHADTEGRPLGLHDDGRGGLLVADARRGLLRVAPGGAVEVLCSAATDGSPLVFTDDLDVAPDGTIWFSDASTRYGQEVWKLDILESRPNGRLLRYTAGVGCEVALADLYFANGVAVAADGAFVLVNETSRYRVRRLWLRGPNTGESDLFIEHLPGFPDGISRDERGHFWIALASPRNSLLDELAPWPASRVLIERLPPELQPAPERHPWIVEVAADGLPIRSLEDPEGRSFGMVTSVQHHGDRLYLGSLTEPAVGWIPTPPEG